MNHLMVDVETLSTRPDAVILSVAWVAFDPELCVMDPPSMYHLDRHDQDGRHIDPNTCKWWFEQSPDAFNRMSIGQKDAAKTATPAEAKMQLRRALEAADHIWANDPDFDCTILRDWVGYDYKWPFWKHRSLRTIATLYPTTKDVRNNYTFVAHDPSEDCKMQIAMVEEAYRQRGNI